MNTELQATLISDVKIRLVECGTDGLVAWTSFVVAQTLKVDNVAIRRGRDGSLFLTYPAKQSATGDRHYFLNPISTDASKTIENAVLARLAALARAAADAGADSQ